MFNTSQFNTAQFNDRGTPVVSTPVAEAEAGAVSPNISVVRHVSVTAPQAEAGAVGAIPVVSSVMNAVISTMGATADAAAKIPSIYSGDDIRINSPPADAYGEGEPPSISVVRHISISVDPAESEADGLTPTVSSSYNIHIAVLPAEAHAGAEYPVVSITPYHSTPVGLMQVAILDAEETRIADLDHALLVDLVEIEALSDSDRLIFSYPITEPEAVHLRRGNKIAATDMLGNWQLYEITSDEIRVSQDRFFVHIEALHVSDELRYKEHLELTQSTVDAGVAMAAALSGTGWQVGTVEPAWTRSISTGLISPFVALSRIARVWEGELKFRVEVSGAEISGRYVDLLNRRGAFRGKAFELSYDLSGVDILSSVSEVKTALYGWGIGEEIDLENGEVERLDFADVEWVEGQEAELHPGGETSPAPVDKPLGQKWVGCPAARDSNGIWSPGLSAYTHRFGEYQSQAQSPQALLWETWRQVENAKEPLVNVRASVLALQQVAGFDHERVDLGDTNYVILPDIVEPIEARVVRIERRRKSPEETSIELGNFRPAASGTIADLKRLSELVEGKASVWDRGAVINPDGQIATSVLDGIIDTVNNQVKAGGGTVWLDDDGFWITDSGLPATSTAAVRGVAYSGDAAMVLGKRDATTDPWDWRVGMTSDGFTIFGEEIVAGAISTDLVRIEGDTSFYWDGQNLYAIDPGDANKQIRFGKYDGTNYGLAITGDGGTTYTVAMTVDGINADAITAGTILGERISSSTKITAGSGDNVGVLDGVDGTYRIYAGHATPASAPFRVTQSGALTATNAIITGTVTATSGSVGGWTIDSTNGIKLGSTSNTRGLSTGTTAFYAGHDTPASAPFRVTTAGALTATNATITGTITSISGSIGGWSIDSTGIKAGSTDASAKGMLSGDTIAFYAGHLTPGNAPFRVTQSGALTATNATITGAITAGSGSSIGYVYISGGPPSDADNTSTIIAGGVVTTGTLEVVQGGSVAAGVTGASSGDTAVRFWAGSSYADRASSTTPFRVLQDGTTYTKNLQASGDGARSLSIGVDAGSGGDDSVAVGNSATSEGRDSVAVGRNASAASPSSTALGYMASATGGSSIALGRETSATAGSSIALGRYADASGDFSTALGRETSAAATTSTALGYIASAGAAGSTALGRYADASGRYSTALGSQATATADHSVRIGASNVTSIGGYADWSNVSDERDKIDIESSEHGLNVITKLNPIKYRLDPRKRYEEKDDDGKVTKHKKDGSKANEKYSYGFSAQELVKALKDTDLDIVDDADSEQLAVREGKLVPVLVKAVQELAAEVEMLKERNIQLEKLIKEGKEDARG